MVNININGKDVQIKEKSSILEAAQQIGIRIPTLCFMKMSDGESYNCKGSCRVCVVEIEGRKDLEPACYTEAKEGMRILTNSTKAREGRKTIIELLLSNHPNDCLNCTKNMNCELQSLARDYGVENINSKVEVPRPIDGSTPIIKNMDKCILCRRCVTACADVQNMNILSPTMRSYHTHITTFNDKPLIDVDCTYCGQCVAVCPTGALSERLDYPKLFKMLEDASKYVVVQMAPAVRVALCEEFGVGPDILTTKKIVSALKLLNFNKVFDTNFSADLTIMEETKELIERISNKENMPLFTSCCPAWVKMVESKYPEYTNLLSSCKSPQEMFGAISKEYLPKLLEINKENLVVASIMPCTSKKDEAAREEMNNEVDIVITSRELAKMIRQAGIDIVNLKEEEFDSPLGTSTGAAMIFGTSGGVMEAALRTAYEKLTSETLQNIDFKEVRGIKGIKEATVKIKDLELKVAVVSSLKNGEKIMEEVIKDRNKYDFIEVMACPGGCVNGGGQPYIRSSIEKIENRMDRVYKEDENKPIRKSHENPDIIKLYEELLNNQDEDLTHKLLHRKYRQK